MKRSVRALRNSPLPGVTTVSAVGGRTRNGVGEGGGRGDDAVDKAKGGLAGVISSLRWEGTHT